jgi:hypothetical protein
MDDHVGDAWLHLKVTEWTQTITSNNGPEEGVGEIPGMTLHAHCAVDAKSSMFRLSSGEDISKMWVQVDLVEGPALFGSGKPVERGIGIFDYGKAVDNIPSGLYCYMGFEPDHYKEIWAQVRSGAFNQSGINLTVGPLPFVGSPADLVWDVRVDHPRLFVLSATVRFSLSRH